MAQGETLTGLTSFAGRVQRWLRRRLAPEFGVQERRPLQWHGSPYGGRMVDPTRLNEQSVVYSFGVGDDISFDLSLIETFGCQVYAFDPTPKSVAWVRQQALPERLHVHAYGIGPLDGDLTFYPPANPQHVSYSLLARAAPAGAPVRAPVMRLQSVMDRLGHDHLDILKLDIEGAEYDVISQIDFQKIAIDQLLVEFHHRFPTVSWKRTRSAVRLLKRAGYRTMYVSQSGDEFSFTRVPV